MKRIPTIKTRKFQLSCCALMIGMLASSCTQKASSPDTKEDPPNILLIMTDDQGWFDAGFNGNSHIKTPHSDALAAQGVILNRFYSASAVCSPTRGSVMTGRNPYRLGIPGANSGHLDSTEITLAELLKKRGYRTGHFGKWHLGIFTTTEQDANRGGRPNQQQHYTVPSEHGYDTYFATESKVPTYDPMLKPRQFKEGESLRDGWSARSDSARSDSDPAQSGQHETTAYGTAYWKKGTTPQKVTAHLRGDDSKLIMDRLLDFITGGGGERGGDESQGEGTGRSEGTASGKGKGAGKRAPFFATVWFHTPHLPVVTNEAYRNMYPGMTLYEQNYFGAITAMDEQLGRLWKQLEANGEAENTLLFFCSDNGPEERTPGSAGPFRADKRDLYEGGVRVPAFVVWKKRLQGGNHIDAPMVTSDYFPTILNLLDIELPKDRTYDGQDIWPLINGQDKQRKQPIGFIYGKQQSWVTDQYKLISTNQGKSFELYDLIKDPAEKNNIIEEQPEMVEKLKKELNSWLSAVKEEKRLSEARWKRQTARK